MRIDPAATEQKTSHNDPRAFVMTLSLGLFTLTCAAIIVMQVAVKYGWQL